MKNIPQEEFEKLCLAVSAAANAADPNVEEGRRIGQEWGPSSVEVKLHYVADIKKFEKWLRQKTFTRTIVVTKVPHKIGHWLCWKGYLAEVYDMADYRRPPTKYQLLRAEVGYE
jgi:hypothetical protein